MPSVPALALCVLTGCDLVFGLGTRVELDAPPPQDEAVPIDACTTSTVFAVADAMLLADTSCNPANRYGAGINVNVGQAGFGQIRSRVLLRFSLTPPMLAALAPDGAFSHASLMLPTQPDACATPCPSTPLGLAMYAAHNDWNEGEATNYIGVSWCSRKQFQETSPTTVLWQVPGADGALDRGRESLGEAMLTAAQVQVDRIELPFAGSTAARAELASWLDGTQLSILLVPTTSTGTLYVKAQEGPGGGAQLSITSCP